MNTVKLMKIQVEDNGNYGKPEWVIKSIWKNYREIESADFEIPEGFEIYETMGGTWEFFEGDCYCELYSDFDGKPCIATTKGFIRLKPAGRCMTVAEVVRWLQENNVKEIKL